MACATLNDLFINFDQLLPGEIYKLITDPNFSVDVWVNNVKRMPWQDGAGHTITYPRYERAYINGDINFQEWLADEAGLGNVPTAEVTSFPSSNVSVTLKRFGVLGPEIYLPDLQLKPFIADQLKNTTLQLAAISKQIWSLTLQREYSNLSGNKIVVNPDLDSGTSAFPVVDPTSPLTWGVLEELYVRLTQVGGYTPYATDDDGAPIFLLFAERETLQNLRNQTQFENQTRFAQMGSGIAGNVLLGTPGLTNGVALRGFKMQTLAFPRHYNIVGGAWVEVNPFATETVLHPTAYGVSTDYKTAAFTESYIFISNAMTHVVPKPAQLPEGYSYSFAQDWVGTFQWKQDAITRDCNPFGDKGFHTAKYVYGARPDRPDLMFVLRHARCKRVLDLVECGSASV